ncbi:uncharacterized protein [Tursiops truncatus]|uniref:uncharacterized protein isoform X2 n=1 Tax=Tursiops truncatus TaxID=9739 RepID=UPI003CCF0C3E
MGVRSSLWPGCDFLASNAQALTFLSCLPHSCSPTAEDSGSPSPGPSRVTHSVTFTITNEAFSAALGNPASLEYQLLSENIRHQLQSVCHEAFSSFEGVGVLLFSPRTAQQKTGPQGKDEGNLDPEAARFQISPHKPLQPHAQARLPPQDMASWSTSYSLSEIPQACHLPLSRSPAPVMPPKMFFSVWLRPDSAAVNASLVFGGLAPGPSAREVLWTLYRKVKAAGKLLGSLYWMRAVSPLRPQPWLCRVRPDRPGPGDHQHPSHGHEALPAPAPPAWLCPLCPAGKDDPPTGHTRAVRILYSTSPGRAPAPLQVGWALPLLPSLPCSSPGGHPGAEGGVTPSQAMGAMGWGPPGEGFVQIAPAGPIKLCPGR